MPSIRDRLSMAIYRVKTRLGALYSLATLSKTDVQAFMDSYILFDGDWTNDNGKSEKCIVDYYYVLNHLCALGNVEKMYIPPLMDSTKGLLQNQTLFELQMMNDIGLLEENDTEGQKKCLEIGCGRGRIALHTAGITGAHVSGLNIEPSQIANAKSFAKRLHLEDQTEFFVGSLNDPLPFEDASLDAAYNVQAFTYAKDYNALFQEVARVLKPGAKFSYLDWVLLDKYNDKDERHKELVNQSMPILGAVNNPPYKQIESAMKRAGLVVVKSQEASTDGPSQAPLIVGEKKQYAWIRWFARWFLPRRFPTMLERMNLHVDALIEGTEEELYTTTYQIVCQKPVKKA